jgi:homoserine kinase type II
MFRYGDLEHVHPLVPAPYELIPSALGLPNSPEIADLLAWWRDELAQLRAWLGENYDNLPFQVIHGDVGPSNTLVQDGRLTGILDFDFALPDARAIDVASGLMFTMRHWENPDPWPMAAAFCQGYRQWIMPTSAEVDATPWLIRLRNAVSTLWWLGRGLADGDVTRALTRIQGMQAFVQWLEPNEAKVIETVRD